MKNLLTILLLMMWASVGFARDYSLQIYKIDENIYKSVLSNAVIITDDCSVPDYQNVILHQGEGIVDTLSYYVTEAVIVDDEIAYREVEVICPVIEAAGLEESVSTIVPECSPQPIWDADANILHLYQIRWMRNYSDTGRRINYGQLHFNWETGVFKPTVLIE